MDIRGAAQVTQQAIYTTRDCEAICIQMIQYCVVMDGAHTEQSHMLLLQDCADACGATAKMLLRGSQRLAQVTNACADLCDACASSCEKFIGDPHMKACANQCRLCATACRQMVTTVTQEQQRGVSGLQSTGLHGAARP